MTLVSDIELGKKDAAQKDIIDVYARRPPLYAVYQSSQVAINFADDPAVEAQQRAAIAPLNPVRNSIGALIDNWRESRLGAFQRKAARYDRRIADALILCLEGDASGAGKLLDETKTDINDERVSWARFEYLIIASLICIVFILAADYFAFWDADRCKGTNTHALWLAAAAGTVGAFFSIATQIRARTVLPNLRRRDNIADAVLRIVVGAIGGATLVTLLLLKVVALKIGDVNFGDAGASTLAIMFAGFVAGFIERFVPDLLAKSVVDTVSPAAQQPKADLPAKDQANTAVAASDPQADTDDCDALHDGANNPPPTDDANLPPAQGGVAQ